MMLVHRMKASALAIAAVLMLWGLAAHAARFYVSPTGKDANPGSRRRPFRTVERARDAVRKVNRRMRADITVELAPGTYRLDRTLTFGPEDSGTRGHEITYRAASRASVVISGGRRVTGWTPDVGGRFKAAVSLGNFRQLWVNGRRATRARGAVPAGLKFWGKHEAVVRPAPGTAAGTLEVTAAAGYTTTDSRVANWKNQTDFEFGYYNSWTHMMCKVQSITQISEGALITMAQPGFFLACRKGGTQAGMPDYMENALELLDKPGEWYFDRAAHVLYYFPRPDEDMATAEVIAPALTTLLEIKGSLGDPAHGLRFEGLTFAHATWLRPSEFGHPDVQANFIAAADNCYQRPEHERGFVNVNGECLKSPANIVVDAARQIHFERCTFTALGGAGVDLQNGAQDSAIRGCRFHDISASGVQVGDVTREDHHPTDSRRVVKSNQITNNVITRIGVEYQDSIGVFCGYTDSTIIAHNEICDLPYTGVSVGWGWGMPDAGGGAYFTPVAFDTPTACRNNRIEFNHIHHVMRQRSDGGGIYTLSRQPGTVLRSNHIHDNGPGIPGGIYLDEGSADIEVTGNLVYGVGWPMNYNNHAQNRIATCREHENLFGLLRTTKGIVGKALRCRNTGIEIAYKPELDAPQLTAEAWLRIAEFPSGTDPRRWVVGKAANEWVDTNYSLFIDGHNVGAYLNIGGGNKENWYTAASTEDPLKLNTWTPIALTYDGDVLRVFCDGREVGAKQIGRPRTTGPAPLAIGGRVDRFGPVAFEGDIDEVRIYSRALSAEELRRNIEAVRKTRGARKPDVGRDGLAGYWGFEEMPAQDAVDHIIAAAGLETAYRHLLTTRTQ